MTCSFSEYVKIVTAILVIVNPLGAVPSFISLTTDQPAPARRRIAVVASFAVGAILVVSCLIGQQILDFFGISISSFRVGGGILILFMAIAMLQARPPRTKHAPEETEEAAAKESIAVVPLALPLLSGPGSISTVIIYSYQSDSWAHIAILVSACILVAALTFLCLYLAIPLSAYLGKTGINIVTRLMGLLLAAVAVEFITAGLMQLLPGLGSIS